ncbi:hypothetical protein POJ06DRAFT_257181 [Lipomyces tetrasporus]|uniref:Uncharacterized protein n=1 Tax=Lipomyces tetrasporus TaxID=54092 RepID=A0AAD7QQJ2_9ASCO|nr:uncharacterized protein POJ06DRAFT_257181 [Lipomyces tetrasporus]KAJ8099515.1 hypothetical protein POJ06DRAFT_257181 [Lipomyces tetrasporus]
MNCFAGLSFNVSFLTTAASGGSAWWLLLWSKQNKAMHPGCNFSKRSIALPSCWTMLSDTQNPSRFFPGSMTARAYCPSN